MNYLQTLDYLYSLRRDSGIKLRLGPMKELLSALNNPQEDFNSVHVTGTNGKGSVCSMVRSVLQKSGLKTGLYTSPHITNFTERIMVGYDEAPRETFVELVGVVKSIIDGLPRVRRPTFFEAVTAVAFKHFSERRVDVAVVEVGMGGRLDATNVVKPIVSVITDVDLDHMEFLGKTVEEIAFEKAGIIKQNTPVVSGVSNQEAVEVIKRVSAEKRSDFYGIDVDFKCAALEESVRGNLVDVFCGNEKYADLFVPLPGAYQLKNIPVAVFTLHLLRKRGFEITPDCIRDGLREVVWPCRFEVMQEKPYLILDGAHNPSGMRQLTHSLKRLIKYRKLFFVLGVSGYKDVHGIMGALPRECDLILTRSSHPQAASVSAMEREAKKLNLSYVKKDNVAEAVSHALASAGASDVVCVGGSLFVAAEARQIWHDKVRWH